MNKDIKDYLHLYLGCKCVINGYKSEYKIATMVGINESKAAFIFSDSRDRDFCSPENVKPILRPLSDMNETNEFFIVNERPTLKEQAENVWYLLHHGFDLFGLIESGLAIDATTLK